MTYARIEGKTVVEYPIHEGDIRLRYRNVSFPTPFQPPEGYVKIKDIDFPDYDYRKNVEDGKPILVDGEWTRNWIITDASDAEIQERTDAQWFFVRRDRNAKLSNCDWTQLPDAPVVRETWTQYRQALRDITKQTDAFSIIWPTEPV